MGKANFGSRWRNHLFGPARSTSSIGTEHSSSPRTTKRPRSCQAPRRSRYPKEPHQTLRSIFRKEIREGTRSTSFPRLQEVNRLFSWYISCLIICFEKVLISVSV